MYAGHYTSQHPDRPVFIMAASGESVSYKEFETRTNRLAHLLRARGLKRLDHFAIFMENNSRYLESCGAGERAGLYYTCTNSFLTPDELAYILTNSESQVLITSRGKVDIALKALTQCPQVRVCLVVDGAAVPDLPARVQDCEVLDFAQAVAAYPTTPIADEWLGTPMLYSSGTTGRPKGCILPNRYFLHSGAWYAGVGGMAALQVAHRQADGTPAGQGGWVQDRMLTPLPLVHMNAMAYSVLAMVLTGGCLIVLDRFHPGSWWDSVSASRATVVHYLGVMPSMLMKAPPQDADRAHRVRFGFGAGVDRALHAPFEVRFGFPLLEAWAMTETGAGAVVMAHREPRQVGTNCFGREGEDVLVRLVADHGGEAGVDEPGELWVRHAGADPRDGFFAGYLKDPEATAEAWAEGWFHTGDIVRRDAQGQLHFIDRRKNVIRRSGENISAVEVESVLNQHPAVKACAVAATPDAVRGDEVLACIVTHQPVADAQRESLARELTEHTLQRLAYYKAPGWVAFVEALPLTASNKIQRGELKALAQALPGQPHCVDTRSLKKRQH